MSDAALAGTSGENVISCPPTTPTNSRNGRNVVTRFMHKTTGESLKSIVTTLRPLREFVGTLGGHEIRFPPDVPARAAALIKNLERATSPERLGN